MIQLDTRNGHDFVVVTNFNKISSNFSDIDILEAILTKWADDYGIEAITNLLKDLQFHDCEGTPLSVGDFVVVLDDKELKNDPPKRGDVLQVTALIDLDSNFIGFGNYRIFGGRVLKINEKKSWK